MLDSLVIKNFRCLEDFRVERLGRLNLIVGGNNSGKSTVLEALRIYAGSANRRLLTELARLHEENFRPVAQNSEETDIDPTLPFQDIFTGRKLPINSGVSVEIGDSSNPSKYLSIQLQFQVFEELVLDEAQPDGSTRRRTSLRRALYSDPLDASTTSVPSLVTSRGDEVLEVIALAQDEYIEQRVLPSVRLSRNVPSGVPIINCKAVSTQLASNDDLNGDWDEVLAKPTSENSEEAVISALRIIEPRVKDLHFVRDGENATGRRKALVLLTGEMRRIPLASMGEGMRRVLQIVLKLVNARDGLLLIDEFENGLHYSVQPKVWTMLFELAEKLNVQVFATTHSWDCIKAFAEVAKANEQVDGVLFHLGRSVRTSNKGQVIATVYDEQTLHDMTQADLEVR